MKVSYNWIKQFINIPDAVEEHAAVLTSLGLEVEGIEPFESVKGGLKGVVVGEVLTCIKHPDADKLKLTTVNIGTATVQIVCGASNVAAGQKVPVATIGTTLYTAEGEAWTIKKGKIRGEESHGMICAEDELGLGKSHDGILVLDSALEVGTPLSTVYEIETDYTIEIGLTPNRADAMSHLGVARDLRAGLAVNGDSPVAYSTPSISNYRVDNRSLRIDVQVENHELAPRYCGVTITDVVVAPSPTWIQNRLKAIGIVPKNNLVDITNYVMHELGQPLHAFDASKIEGSKIVVKTVAAGTPFTTLDGVEHKLHEEDLMICDTEKPLCIAGVYGGLGSGVTAETTSIFLESAYFNPVSVRKTAKRHGFNTDASFRFERGIDPNITEYALQRAAQLIIQYANGKVSSDHIDSYPNKIENLSIFLPYAKVDALIGQEIPREEIKSILRTLDIEVNNVSETGLGLTIPAYRNDVTRPVDVIEEILRVYGYDRIEIPSKLHATTAVSSRTENNKIQNLVAQQLVGQGFHEMMANSLTSDKYQELDGQMGSKNEVRILNPLSSDLAVMRQSMVYGALEAVSYNMNRRQHNLRLFEFGNTYHTYQQGNYTENKHLSITITGDIHTNSWSTKSHPADFFYLKGVVMSLLSRLGIQNVNEQESKLAALEDGIALNAGNKIADLGIVSASLTRHFGIDTPVYYANIYWDEILKLIKDENKPVTEISKFPSVKRDLALLVNNEVTFKELKTIALATERSLLQDVSLFDVYEGKNLAAGKKSYALSFTIQDHKKTLTDKQIDKVMQKIQSQLEKETGAVLR
ncbi:MAG: phenylalanine--tRNA ligase subunit beta [Nonlabens sp.]|nr:phenylalanine--tRNA ligase subunit beta [Nonlabens sp.]